MRPALSCPPQVRSHPGVAIPRRGLDEGRTQSHRQPEFRIEVGPAGLRLDAGAGRAVQIGVGETLRPCRIGHQVPREWRDKTRLNDNL